MLNKLAFANSITILVTVFYIIFYTASLITPAIFEFIFNAQFFGADVASLMPQQLSLPNFIGVLITLVVTGWVMSYFWAWLYNKFSK
jgi:hypothetical protein